MSQSTYNQIVAIASGVVSNVSVPVYYDRIIVTNETSGDIYVSTDGSAVSTAEGSFGAVVLPGAWRMIGNDQPRQPLVSPTKSGSTVQNTGWHGATQGNLEALASGAATYVSILGPSAGGNVGLEFV